MSPLVWLLIALVMVGGITYLFVHRQMTPEARRQRRLRRVVHSIRSAPPDPLVIDRARPLPKPDVQARVSRLHDEQVITGIAELTDRLFLKDSLQFDGADIRAALDWSVVDFNAAESLVNRVFARDIGAETEFRELLHRIGIDLGELGSFTPPGDFGGGFIPELPCNFRGANTIASLYTAAMFIAADTRDWQSMRAGVDSIFLQTEWTESIHTAYDHYRQTGNSDAFHVRARQFERSAWFTDFERNSGLPPRDSLSPQPGSGPIASFGKRPPMDTCGFMRAACVDAFRGLLSIVHASRQALWFPVEEYAFINANGITSISPDRACAGQEVIVAGGGFGATKPDNVELVMASENPGFDKACRVVITHLWTDTEIRFMMPDWGRSGTIGFLDTDLLENWRQFAQWVGDVLDTTTTEHVTDGEFTGERCGYRVSEIFTLVEVPVFPCPPDTGANFFWGSVPEIEFPDYPDNQAVVAPGSFLVVAWTVTGANPANASINISETPLGGPPDVTLTGGNIVSGSFSMDFTGVTSDQDRQLRVTATNACGTVNRTVDVFVRRARIVSIMGIENIQVVQKFDLSDTTHNNSIPLVEEKATMIRVYLESNVPNNYTVANDVTGELLVAVPPGAANPIGGYPFAPYPHQPRQTVRAPNAASLNRESITSSLNFVLPPEACVGTATIDLNIRSTESFATWPSFSTTFTLVFDRTRALKLWIFKVTDHAGRVTSDLEIEAEMQQLERILPLSSFTGIDIVGVDTIFTDLDFEDDDAWLKYDFTHTDMFDLLEGAAQDHPNEADIYCAIISEASRPGRVKGKAWPGGVDFFGGTSERIAYWRASPAASRSHVGAHEIGHAINLNHSDKAIRTIGMEIDRTTTPTLRGRNISHVMEPGSSTNWMDEIEYTWFFDWSPNVTANSRSSSVFATVVADDLTGHITGFEFSSGSYSSFTISSN